MTQNIEAEQNEEFLEQENQDVQETSPETSEQTSEVVDEGTTPETTPQPEQQPAQTTQPAVAGVSLTPEEYQQLQRAKIEAQAYQDFIRTQGQRMAQGYGQGQQPNGGVNANQPNPIEEELKAAKARLEAGDPTAIDHVQKAMAMQAQLISQQQQAVMATAMQPFIQQQQQQRIDSEWKEFCMEDEDLATEFRTKKKNPTAPTPIRDAMQEQLQSGNAGNWQGALWLAKIKLGKNPMSQPEAPQAVRQATAVPKTTMLAANAVAGTSRSVTPSRGIDYSKSDKEVLVQCLRETDAELGRVRR